VLKGGNLGSSCYSHMLPYTRLGVGTWHCALGYAHPISRLRAAARSRFVLNPGDLRFLAKQAMLSSHARMLRLSTEAS
jgi:hypothetical protein